MVVRQPDASDAAALMATVDDVVVRTSGWNRAHAAAMRSEPHVRAGMLAGSHWLITERELGAVIGSVSVHGFDASGTSCELGWWLGPSWRRRGYGSEAVEVTVAALHRAGVARVRFGTAHDNIAVHRIARKLGAVVTRSGPHELPDGSVISAVWYAHVATGQPGPGAGEPAVSTLESTASATRRPPA